MPELFGNAYILPVVVVVVLLLALLLILMIRRRQSASARDAKHTERVTTSAIGSTPTEAPEKRVASFSAGDEPARAKEESAVAAQATIASGTGVAAQAEAPAQIDTAAQADAVAEADAATETAASQEPSPPVIPKPRTGPSPQPAAPTDDPLKAVIVDIVHGWGDLTSEDTNRLDLFRPDKVLAVAESIELPKEDAGGGYAHTRLLEIRKYAADKQMQREPSEQATLPASEPAAETETAHPDSSSQGVLESEAPEVQERVRRPVWQPPQPDGAGAAASGAGAGLAGAGLAAAGLATAAAGDSGEAEQIEDRESLERALADGESEWSAPEPIESSPWIQTPEPEESTAPWPWPEASQVTEPEDAEPRTAESSAPSPWSEAPAGWDVQEPTTLTEVPVEPDTETPMPEAEEPPPVEDMTARAQASDDSLSSLHLRVRTADELMALPRQEQTDMLAFLEPPELARVIETSEDRELKKSVIDVLENLGNTASLDVLRRCLDDPDQEIQLYALDAADRLLGEE